MKLLDRYIIRQFVVSVIVAIIGFVVIFIAIDLMEKLDKFLDRGVPAMVVVEYYVNFTPQMIALVLPIAMLLGCLFSAGKMSQNSEIVATRSAGMSLYRFMAPFVIVAVIISSAAIYFNGWIMPRANAKLLSIRRSFGMEQQIGGTDFNMHVQNAPGEILVVQDFAITQGRAERVGLYYFDPQHLTHLYRRIDARQMLWDSTKKSWKLVDGVERIFGKDSTEEILHHLTEKESVIHLSFTPRDLVDQKLQTNETSEITNTDFRRRIELAQSAGKDTARDEVDYQAKYALAFASLIVVLFGVPFASQKKRGGLAIQFAVAIGIAFVYLAFTKVSFTFGYTGQINPILTAWMANGLFLLLAIGVMLKVQK
jgi:lipopolysaccharide export system permease protein